MMLLIKRGHLDLSGLRTLVCLDWLKESDPNVRRKYTNDVTQISSGKKKLMVRIKHCNFKRESLAKLGPF